MSASVVWVRVPRAAFAALVLAVHDCARSRRARWFGDVVDISVVRVEDADPGATGAAHPLTTTPAAAVTITRGEIVVEVVFGFDGEAGAVAGFHTGVPDADRDAWRLYLADRTAAELRAAGIETSVECVPAY